MDDHERRYHQFMEAFDKHAGEFRHIYRDRQARFVIDCFLPLDTELDPHLIVDAYKQLDGKGPFMTDVTMYAVLRCARLSASSSDGFWRDTIRSMMNWYEGRSIPWRVAISSWRDVRDYWFRL
jgi:hypothetical protein